MLDIKFIRENIQVVKIGLERRNGKFSDLEDLLRQEEERREGLQESEQLKVKKRNFLLKLESSNSRAKMHPNKWMK